MRIAATMLTRANPDLVADTIQSVKRWMTNDIHLGIDAAGWDHFRNFDLVKPEKQEYWNFFRSPHRNVSTCVRRVFEKFNDAIWFCYIEPDCLVVNNFFLQDLKTANRQGIWLMAAHHRVQNHPIPELLFPLAGEVSETHICLGACVFYHRNYLQKLYDLNFFDNFLKITEPYIKQPGFFPGFTEHALEETVMPSLAIHLGGKIQELGCWDGCWKGPTRYRLRCPQEVPQFDICNDTSIVHPLREIGQIREYFRKIRER